MNLKNRLRHLAQKLDASRAYGKTTLLTKVAKELNAVFIVHNNDDVRRLSQPSLTVKSMDMNMEGFFGPFIMDHHAVSRMFNRAADKIESLEGVESKYEQLKQDHDQLKQDYETLKLKYDKTLVDLVNYELD